MKEIEPYRYLPALPSWRRNCVAQIQVVNNRHFEVDKWILMLFWRPGRHRQIITPKVEGSWDPQVGLHNTA
jgi:hypothetical protein